MVLIIHSVVIYGTNARILTNADEYLLISETKILIVIYGTVMGSHGPWQIRMNHELKQIIGNEDIRGKFGK